MPRLLRCAVAVALLLPLHLPAQSATSQSNPQIRVTAGTLEGVIAPDGVRMFKGIPFAAPPVGPLRWAAPQPVRGWKGVRSAAGFGPRCMQLPIFSDMVFRSNGVSEDCLYLNVWAPPAARKGAKLPVLVYFFGGGFIAGDGSEFRYDGESLAARGIVAVTVNYRLGVFGFLAHPELTKESPRHASGNYGLLDQAAALQWVRRNIAAFGGDPARVTIAGESAGSMSVSAQMASPLSRKLIAGAIGESGAIVEPARPPVALADAEQAGVRFAASLASGPTMAAAPTASSPDSRTPAAGAPEAARAAPATVEKAASPPPLSLQQLRAIPADTLLRLASRPGAGRFSIIVDGYFLTEPPARTFAAGRQSHVPLLAGWNTEESGWRSLLGNREPTPAGYAEAVRRLYGDRADELLRLLPAETGEQVMDAAALLAGARFIAFGTWKWTELQARTGGRPVYRYLYARPRPATVQPTAAVPPRGAVHSAEIEYALGNLATNHVYAWTPDDFKVSELLEGYFANFIRTGDPNGPGLPAWPAAAGDTIRTMIVDVQPRVAPEPHRDVYQFLDRFSPAAAK